MNICERLKKEEKDLSFDGEILTFQEDARDPYLFIVALRQTPRERLAGGVHCGVLGRDWANLSDAITHIARKADNMHEKIVLHGLHKRHDVDGLKVGIVCNHELSPRERVNAFLSLGHLAEVASERLEKICLFGGDVGTSENDLLMAWSTAPNHIVGRPRKDYRGVGETGPTTAKGVFQTIGSANLLLWKNRGKNWKASAAIQGLGNVGRALAQEMLACDWDIEISDVDPECCRDLKFHLSLVSHLIRVISPSEIHKTTNAVFVPCALHPIIRKDTIQKFSSDLRMIVSAQNNEIDPAHADELAEELHARGIVYIPGPLANAMGIRMLLVESELLTPPYSYCESEELRDHREVVESILIQSCCEHRSIYSIVQERIRLAS